MNPVVQSTSPTRRDTPVSVQRIQGDTDPLPQWTDRDYYIFNLAIKESLEECSHEEELAEDVWPNDMVRQAAYRQGCNAVKSRIEDIASMYEHTPTTIKMDSQ
jgi:hypothetical protein